MRWSGWPVHQLSTHGSRCRKCGGAPHGWCGSSSCEEDRNPQPTFLGLNLNLKMVWRAVKLATGCFHFFHQSSGSPGVLGVPESWESRESRSLGSLGSPGVSNCKLYLCQISIRINSKRQIPATARMILKGQESFVDAYSCFFDNLRV